MSVVAQISVTPLGVGESLSRYVAMAVEVIQSSGVNYKLCPMGTVIEGDWDDIFRVIRGCQERLASETGRVVINMRADWRKGPGDRMDRNVSRVQEKLARPAKT